MSRIQKNEPSKQLIGFGIASTAIALVTDQVFGDPAIVGFSIAIVGCTAAVLAGWLLATAMNPFRELAEDAAGERATA